MQKTVNFHQCAASCSNRGQHAIFFADYRCLLRCISASGLIMISLVIKDSHVCLALHADLQIPFALIACSGCWIHLPYGRLVSRPCVMLCALLFMPFLCCLGLLSRMRLCLQVGGVFASQNSGLVPRALSALALPPASRAATCGLLPLCPAGSSEAEALLGKGICPELLFFNH
jgi:hypothetical protein